MRSKTDKFIASKLNDIFSDSQINKAYNLGVAVGILYTYRMLRDMDFHAVAVVLSLNLDKSDSEIFSLTKELIEMDHEKESEVEKLIRILSNPPHDDAITEEERKLIEEYIEFKRKKGDKKNEDTE